MESNEENQLIPSCKSLIFEYGKDVVLDIAEITIDSLLNDGILKEVPIVDTVQSSVNLVCKIIGRFKAKHILVFAQNVNSNEESTKKIRMHYEKLKEKKKLMQQEMEVIVSSIISHDKYIKDKILANFYLEYCDPNVKFEWRDFEEMLTIVDALFPYDLACLEDIYNKGVYNEGNEYNRSSISRLSNLNLVDYYNEIAVTGDVPNAAAQYYTAKITKTGKYFWEHGLKEIDIFHDIDGESRIL